MSKTDALSKPVTLKTFACGGVAPQQRTCAFWSNAQQNICPLRTCEPLRHASPPQRSPRSETPRSMRSSRGGCSGDGTFSGPCFTSGERLGSPMQCETPSASIAHAAASSSETERSASAGLSPKPSGPHCDRKLISQVGSRADPGVGAPSDDEPAKHSITCVGSCSVYGMKGAAHVWRPPR